MARQGNYVHNCLDVKSRMASYVELRTLSNRGIGGRRLQDAEAFLDGQDLGEANPSPELDRLLLQRSQANNDPHPLLCLRCHISHPLEAWVRALHGRFHTSYDLDLKALASYALDDTGGLTLRCSPDRQEPFTFEALQKLPSGLISPFSGEVLRTYDPSRCGLPHWARMKLQCHNELKAYLRQQGLLLISDWALLADSSPRRICESWDRCGSGAYSSESMEMLHSRFRTLYREAMAAYRSRTGKGSGWQPDQMFLQELAPDQAPTDTSDQLQSMATAVRKLMSGRWMQSTISAGDETADQIDPNSEAQDDDENPGEAQAMRVQIEAAIAKALDATMPGEMAREQRKFTKAPERLLAWKLYGEGMSQREIAQHCDHQQAWVSKLLDEKRRSGLIATAAAAELKHHSTFAALMNDVEGCDRLVTALRNHLIEAEREGADIPLRRWVMLNLPNQ